MVDCTDSLRLPSNSEQSWCASYSLFNHACAVLAPPSVEVRAHVCHLVAPRRAAACHSASALSEICVRSNLRSCKGLVQHVLCNCSIDHQRPPSMSGLRLLSMPECSARLDQRQVLVRPLWCGSVLTACMTCTTLASLLQARACGLVLGGVATFAMHCTLVRLRRSPCARPVQAGVESVPCAAHNHRSACVAHSRQQAVMESRPGIAMKVGGLMKLSGPKGSSSGNSFLRLLVQTVSVACSAFSQRETAV
eukprot:3697681-Amphidinium_carterae.2